MLDYLDQTRGLGLLSDDPVARAKAQAAAYAIAVDIHPVCNLSVMVYATGGQEPGRSEWMKRFNPPPVWRLSKHFCKTLETIALR